MDSLRIEWDDSDVVDDDIVHPDIPVTIPFAWTETKEVDEEEFVARGDVPFGLLIEMEDQRPGAMTAFFDRVFYDDDNDRDDNDEAIVGTSSLARWRKLAHDPDRRVPGTILTKVFQGLYGEYASRNGLRGPARPTSRRAPSRAQRRQTGRGSTAKRGARASISAAPEPE